MSEQDQPQRDAVFDRMMTEGKQLIEQAREVASRLDATLNEVCDKDAISDFLASEQCPEELRQMAQEDIDKLMEELEQEEHVLASESRVSEKRMRKPRRGMNKI